MTIYHKHHIVPQYMGGSDDPSNIVELTIEEHAEAHRILYETYGDERDKVAWQGLLGLIPKAEIMTELHKLGRRKTDQILYEKYGVINPGQLPHVREMTSARTKKMHEMGLFKIPDWTGKKHSDETKRKIGLKNSVYTGPQNSQYGTMWITNGSENKKIKSIDLIPEGWYKGRVIK